MTGKISDQRELITEIAKAILDEIDCNYDLVIYRGEVDGEFVNSILSVTDEFEHKYVRNLSWLCVWKISARVT